MTTRSLVSVLLAGLCFGLGACGDDDTSAPASAARSASAASFPVDIRHKLGTTKVPGPPERVVALGQSDVDVAFALGVKPVAAAKYWNTPDGKAPWLRSRYAGADVRMLDGAKPSLETITGLRPDLVLAGTFWGVEQIYNKLDRVAPTLTYRTAPLGDSWQEQTTTVGRALGKEGEARRLVAGLERKIAEIKREHPQLEGKTFSYSYHFAPGAIQTINATKDFAAQIGVDLGMRLAPGVQKLKGDSGAQISLEKLPALDADVLVMAYQSDALRRSLERNPLFRRIPAVRRGDYVMLDLDAVSALRTPSVLSIPYGLDALVPGLARSLS